MEIEGYYFVDGWACYGKIIIKVSRYLLGLFERIGAFSAGDEVNNLDNLVIHLGNSSYSFFSPYGSKEFNRMFRD